MMAKPSADDAKKKKHVRSGLGGEIYKETDVTPNVLLERILEMVSVHDVQNYPAWYFGAMGARGYFEHGPWAARADINITNDNHCGKSRKNVGPWSKLVSLPPAPGR